MKKALSLILVVLGFSLTVQSSPLEISGNVYDLSNNNIIPVKGQAVLIHIDSTNFGFVYFDTLITDENGWYHTTIEVPPSVQFSFLTVSTFDSCYSFWQIFEEMIIGDKSLVVDFSVCMGIGNDCQALFGYSQNPEDPLTIQFQNESIGNFTNSLWQFGDGSVSTEKDPIHKFSGSGKYMICLTIFDTLSACSDIYCEEMTITDTITQPVSADFIFYLDSLIATPNVYHFESTSTGEIDHWLWDFGDGNFAEGPSVTHQYYESGIYTICLDVLDSSGYFLQSDYHCIEITTPQYTYFGGQVFAGSFPLNNPVSTGDTGVAVIYRLFEDMLVLLDTNYIFNDAGLYTFNNLLYGDYIIKAGLTKGSEHYNNYFPSYYMSSLTWQNAQTINISDPVYDAGIQLIPTQNMEPGAGSIRGYLEILDGNPEILNLADIEIILMDELKNPLQFSTTNAEGSFEFTNLPNGTYYVMGDYAGWIIGTKLISLTEVANSIDGVSLDMALYETFGIDENIIRDHLVIKVYPNPVSDILNVEVSDIIPGEIMVTITDLLGRDHTVPGPYYLTESTIRIPVDHLGSGAYLLNIKAPGISSSASKFFVK